MLEACVHLVFEVCATDLEKARTIITAKLFYLPLTCNVYEMTLSAILGDQGKRGDIPEARGHQKLFATVSTGGAALSRTVHSSQRS